MLIKIKLWLFNKLISFLKIDDLWSELKEFRQIIKDRTDLHADIWYKSTSTIIAVGRYRGQDYVQVYNISDSDFKGFIERLKEMEKYGHIGRVDSPPTMRAVFKHEFD